jgi:hypothetical protein
MIPRQARLRLSISDWYPRITPGQWHHALWVREVALANLRKGMAQWQEREGHRVLSDSHFEFRGGQNGPKETRDGERRMLRRDGPARV